MADQGFTETEGRGNPAGIVYDQIAADDNGSQSEDDIKQAGMHWKKMYVIDIDGISDGGDHSDRQICSHQNEENQSFRS